MSSDESDMKDAEKEKCDESETKDANLEKSDQLAAVVEDITMDTEVWKRIPEELQTCILEHCPVPDLCRFRLVSRAWNNLIRHDPTFALEARHQGKYIFKTPDKVLPGVGKTDGESRNLLLQNCWEIFDPSRQKFWSMSVDFLFDAVVQPDHPRLQGRLAFRNVCLQTVAADKGFVCVLWSEYRLKCDIMRVVNPATRSVIRIPSFQANNQYTYKAGAMTVADDYSSFTLYIAYVTFALKLMSLRGTLTPSQLITPCQMLHMNEKLYMCCEDGHRYQLFVLNKAGDEWMNVGVELPMTNWVVPKLATTLRRLFFVQFNNTTDMVVISEIDTMSREFMLVTRIEKRNNDIKLLESLDCTIEGLPSRSIMVSN